MASEVPPLSWIITDPPPSLRLIADNDLWVNVQCGKCRRVRSLRGAEINGLIAYAGKDLTLDDLKRQGKCSAPGCDGRVGKVQVGKPNEQPSDKHVTWDEWRLLKAMHQTSRDR